MFGSRKAKESPAGSAKARAGGTQQPVVPPSNDKSHGAAANGGKPPHAGEAPRTEEAQRRAVVALRQSLAFAQIISVLMRSPHYKHYTLADIEWLVLPPLLSGQFSIAEAGPKKGGPRTPVAVALWASVSSEVDKRLSDHLTTPIRLRPDEWKSGDILWLVDAVGDGRILPGVLHQLSKNVWKGREVKARIARSDGTPEVTRLSDIQSNPAEKRN